MNYFVGFQLEFDCDSHSIFIHQSRILPMKPRLLLILMVNDTKMLGLMIHLYSYFTTKGWASYTVYAMMVTRPDFGLCRQWGRYYQEQPQ